MSKEIIDNIKMRKEDLKRQLEITQKRVYEIRESIQRMATSRGVYDIKQEVENLDQTTHEYLDIKKRISLLNDLLLEDEFY